MRKVLLLVAMLFCNVSFAGYSTPGSGVSWSLNDLVTNSGGSVTFSGGEYFVNDTLTISASDTVKILTNETLKFAGGSFIDIFGTFIINPPDSVKITAQDTNANFLGLKFEEFSDASLLRKLIFEYGGSIRLVDCDMLIDNCIIRNNPSTVFARGAISLFRSNATISNCTIYRSGRAAIVSGANISSSPKILYNRIYDNNTQNGNYPQINIGATGADSTIIRGNIITGGPFDRAGGISFFPIGSIPLLLIEGNIIAHNRYGIAIGGSNVFAIIRNNRIDSNNIEGTPLTGGSGINFNGSGQVSIVTGNSIRGNLWGITIQNAAKPNMGDIGNASTLDNGMNEIHNNGNTGQIYDLYNNTPDSIKAENNYWGTSIADTVEAHIFHKPDDNSLGFVDFMPLSGPTGVIQQTGESQPDGYRLSEAYPNPFNPETNIEFTLPVSSLISLKIYDVSGREVATLVNEFLGSGTYTAKWNAVNFSSGIYFVRFQSKGISLTRMLALVK